MRKIIGILGGMGPLATVDLFDRIVKLTPAKSDSEHLRILIDCNPAIPDRTEYIVSGAENPAPALIATAQNLEKAGADFLIMPCNTAHYFYDEICRHVAIPFLHMPREVAKLLSREGVFCAGLLATVGTIRGGVYEKALSEAGIKTVHPTEGEQAEVNRVIYDGIKAGNFSIDSSGLRGVAESLLERGAQRLILGCTELPIAFNVFQIKAPIVDATQVLAQAAVAEALNI